MATGNAITKVLKGELSLEVENEKVTINVFRALKDPPKSESCCEIITVDMSIIQKNPFKTTKHPKEPDKAWKVNPEPIIAKSEEFQKSEHHERATSYNCKGRVPKFKNFRNESSKPWPSPLHYVDLSGMLEEKFCATH